MPEMRPRGRCHEAEQQ
jgi:hypothetical protein